MDLWKVEFHIKDACMDSVASASLTVNDADGTTITHTPVYQSYGPGKLVFKASGASVSHASVGSCSS
jgi:hypothetical protein